MLLCVLRRIHSRGAAAISAVHRLRLADLTVWRGDFPPVGRALALPALILLATAVAPRVDASPAQPAPTITYTLAETWADLPRESVAGRFRNPVDVSSAPDGTVYVLDRDFGLNDPPAGGAIAFGLHRLGPDAAPLGVVPLAPHLRSARRVDVSFDGVVHVVGGLPGAGGGNWGVARLAADGTTPGTGALALTGTGVPLDVAVGPDDRVYLTLNDAPDHLDVYTPDGQRTARIVPGAMGPDGPDDRFTYELTRLDVAADGTVYVIARAWRPCPPDGPQPPRPTPPPPTPTPRPSLGNDPRESGDAADPVPDQPDPLPCQKDIVLVFEADLSFREEVPNPHRTDIAVGPSGVYVSASDPFRRPSQRIYALGAEVASLAYRAARRLDLPAALSASHMQLDVAADGGLHAVTDLGAPFYRGGLTFPDPRDGGGPTTGPEGALGIYERPDLSGPHNPRRIAAADAVMLLEEPYQRDAATGRLRTRVDRAHDASAIQRWALTGKPVSQVVHHTDLLRDNATGSDIQRTVAPLFDVAYDGANLYGMSPQIIWHRPDAMAPDWYRRVAGAHFLAASAHNGHIAVLNGAVGRVLVMDDSGRVVFDRPISGGWSNQLVGDLALHGDRVYLADQGHNRILVQGVDGTYVTEWTTLDGPRRVSVSRSGDVLVLGRGGTGQRYTPDGALVAVWRVPETHDGVPVGGQDIAVGDDDRVYVAFVGLSPVGERAPGADDEGYAIDAGGVWVFEPSALPEEPDPAPDPGACEAWPTKSADPLLMLLGETVDVTLDVGGRCPGRFAPHQLVVVLDTSWSMHDNYFLDQSGPGALSRAKDLLGALLASMDPTTVEVGLVTFSGGAGVDVPLPGDLGLVRGRILSRIADGDTRMGVGVSLAHGQLTGAAGDPGAKQTILIVSDGVFKDDPTPAIRAAQGDGIEIVTVVLTTPEFDGAAHGRLTAAIGADAPLFFDPVPAGADALIDVVSAYIPNPGLFETITIEDVVPGDMAYLAGSALPAAQYDAPSRTLRWTLGPVTAADGVHLTYRLRPLETGRRATNVRADATYVDALGNDGRLTFPVPYVHVLAPDPLATPTPTPTPIPTPTTRPEYRAYLPYAVREPFCVDKTVHADVVLVLDMSTSMFRLTNAGRTKHDAALEAARMFIDQLQVVADAHGSHDQVAIVGFNDRAWTATALTTDRARLDAALDSLLAEIREGTRLDLAFTEAQRVLVGPSRRSENTPAMILLTDGLPNRVPTPVPSGGQEDTVLAAAQRAKDAGTVVYTIGLGQPGDVRAWMLRAAASDPSMYYQAPDGEDLAEIYRRILVRLVCGPR